MIEALVEDEIGDLTADFVEQEVGRLDWLKNIDLLKTGGKLKPRLDDWLSRMGYDQGLAGPIMDEIDRLVKMPGRWM